MQTKTKITESNRSYMSKWSGLVPASANCTTDTAGDRILWYPEKGVWYSAEAEGTVGGGHFGAGMNAYVDKGIRVLPGDRFRLKSHGNVACPSVWEVAFTSPLRTSAA